MSKQVEQMKKMGYSDAEIADMLACDKAIDQGKKMPWDLSDEDHKKAIKQANAGEKKETSKKPRKAKENPGKQMIISEISQVLERISDSVEVVNPEREISFQIDGVCYKITLSVPRK
jgi:hypothetical protein